MSTKKQRTLDKKRKAKRNRNLANKRQESLAYGGDKYKTEELVPVIFETEISILEAFVMSERQISDRDVEATIIGLIGAVRSGRLQTLEEITDFDMPLEGDADDLVTAMVRRKWHEFFQYHPYPGRDKLVGMLRTILGSIEVWTTPNRVSRGYLLYIEKFLSRAGVSVQCVSEEEVAEVGLDVEPVKRGLFSRPIRRISPPS